MNYTVTDNSTFDIFDVEIYFNEDISAYVSSNMLRIEILDITGGNTLDYREEHTEYIYINDIIAGIYGLIPPQPGEPVDRQKQLEQSLANNGGIVILYGGDTIRIVIAAKSSDGNTIIGRNSSNVTLRLMSDDDEIPDTAIKLYADLFPKIIRSEIITQGNPADPDPVLPAPDIRPAYDFNQDIPSAIMGNVYYSTTNTFYTNTGANESTVPLYVSELSAYMPTGASVEYDWNNAESYLYDEYSSQKYVIDFTKGDDAMETFLVFGEFSATVDCYPVVQYISASAPGLYKNKLVFNLDIKYPPEPEE